MLKIDTWVRNDCTVGFLSYEGFQCFTLELPWRDNNGGVSCIPAGVYKAKKYNSPQHGEVILLIDVHGRTFIEIHAGNFTRQILGCILVGDGIKYLDGDSIPDVSNSKATLKELLALLPNEFDLHIERHW